MKNNKKILAIIPARSGSQGLKNKNILKLNKKPLLSYPIVAAKNSKYIDMVLCSTDSPKYITIAEKFGAKCPFLRPKSLSSQKTSSYDVIIHTIKFLKKTNNIFDYVALLEPTSPLTTAIDIDRAIDEMFKKKCLSCVSLGKSDKIFSNNIYKLRKNIIIPIYEKKRKHFRRQDIKEYFLDGSLYISDIKSLIKNKGFVNKNTYGYVIQDRLKNLEIDDKFDYLLIKKLLNG